MVNTNPYTPAATSPAAGPTASGRRLWRTALGHTAGLLAFTLGLVSWYILAQIPQIHPAYGGADPARVIGLLLGLAAGCGLLSLVVIVHALYVRRFFRLLYALPPASFVGWLTLAFFQARG